MDRVSDFFFFIHKILIFPKNGASEGATIFLQNSDSPEKWGERRSTFFFKERKVTLTWFEDGGKQRCLQTKMKRQKNKTIGAAPPPQKKMEWRKKLNHGKIEAANPSFIKLICRGLSSGYAVAGAELSWCQTTSDVTNRKILFKVSPHKFIRAYHYKV